MKAFSETFVDLSNYVKNMTNTESLGTADDLSKIIQLLLVINKKLDCLIDMGTPNG